MKLAPDHSRRAFGRRQAFDHFFQILHSSYAAPQPALRRHPTKTANGKRLRYTVIRRPLMVSVVMIRSADVATRCAARSAPKRAVNVDTANRCRFLRSLRALNALPVRISHPLENFFRVSPLAPFGS